MNKPLLILFLVVFSCKTTISTSIRNCIDKEHLSIINKGIEVFEAKLYKSYPNLTIEKAYFKFLEDYRNKKLNPEFFKIENINSIKELEIWDVSIRTEKHMKLEAKLFNVDSMNPNRTTLNKNFSQCLANLTESEGIQNFLLSNSIFRMSPKRTKKMIYAKTNESDLKKYENRLAIALAVYYQTALNLN